MKIANNILYALAAALLMVGCAKVEPDFEIKQAEDLDITFQVGNYAAATKAEYEALDTRMHFGTLCTFTPGEYELGSGTRYMDNAEISYVEGSNVWKATETYRWPKAGKLSFVSYAPYKANANVELVEDHKIKFNNYTVSDEDLMYSEPVKNQSENKINTYGNGFNGVPTLFHHALTQLVFIFNCSDTNIPDGAEIILKDAQIKNVANTGSYIGGESIWTSDDTRVDNSICKTDESGKKVGISLYAIPQNLEKSATDEVMLEIKAEMVFKLKDVNGEDVDVTTPINVTVPMATDDIAVWESGKRIEYTITITGDAALIKFSGKVNEWQTETSKDILI